VAVFGRPPGASGAETNAVVAICATLSVEANDVIAKQNDIDFLLAV